MIHKTNLLDDDALPWQRAPYHLSARYKAIPTGGPAGVEVHIVEVAAGGRILPHAQPWDEWLLCLAGHATVTLGEESAPLHLGEALRVPGGAVQGLDNPGAEPLRLLLLLLRERAPDPMTLLKLWWQAQR